MFVMIQAVDSERDTGPMAKGKFTSLQPEDFEITLRSDVVHIQAKVSETTGTGKRGGQAKTVIRRLTLGLEGKDIEKILDAAIQRRLVSVPGLQHLAEAKKQLEDVTKQIEQALRSWQKKRIGVTHN